MSDNVLVLPTLDNDKQNRLWLKKPHKEWRKQAPKVRSAKALLGQMVKGGPGSGNFGHAGRPGEVGGSAPDGAGGAAGAVRRVWEGKQHETDPGMTKLDTGAIGEEVTAQVLGEVFGTEMMPVNVGVNNAPFDLAGDGIAVEVKAGLASNRSDAWKWRATIGQPGKAERELLKQMTPEQKLEHNKRKMGAILERKHNLLDRMAQEAGKPYKPYTAGVIISGDGKSADVYLVEDFHLSLRWNKYATDQHWVATVDLESKQVAWNPQAKRATKALQAPSRPGPSVKASDPLLDKALAVALAEVDREFEAAFRRWRKQVRRGS